MTEKKEWTKLETRTAHNFKETNKLEGTLKAREESQYGGYDYVVESDGKDVLVFGKTALQTKLNTVEIGTDVKIVYLGEKKSEKSGRTYEDFDVFTA